jgi:CyaY protein
MTDPEYLDRAEALLGQVEAGCDRINDTTDADIDSQRVGGMVTLTFRNRSQIIVNLQKPLQEVWLAAKAGGFHYKFDGVRWMDTKGRASSSRTSPATPAQQAGEALVFGA